MERGEGVWFRKGTISNSDAWWTSCGKTDGGEPARGTFGIESDLGGPSTSSLESKSISSANAGHEKIVMVNR